MSTGGAQGSTETDTWRILIVDDHALVRQGLKELIQREPGLEVCGEAESADEALEVIEERKPDLAILDLALRGSHGLDLIGQIKAQFPSVRILVLSMHDEKIYAERCLRAGAEGYVQKRDTIERVVQAIRSVLAGQVHVSEELSSELLQRMVSRKTGSSESAIASLSNRELQLLELIGQGMTTQEIADHLGLSTKTIHTYREHLKTKLDVDNVYQLVRYAVAWTLRKD